VSTVDQSLPPKKGWFGSVAIFLEFVSGEYLLTRLGHSNGGTVVLLRSLHVSAIVFAFALLAINVLDPARGGPFCADELRRQLLENGKWFGALFGAAYAALYARFASQWSYLAGVYNQIKAAQARKDHDEVAVAEWRAGFIEDCDELHLVRKPMFASIVHAFLSDDMPAAAEIRKAFDLHTPGGEARRLRIESEVKAVVERVGRHYPKIAAPTEKV
jgi:hypothetical protein